MPDGPGPVIEGSGELGFQCPHCEEILGAQLFARQVFDIVIECGRCRRHSAFPPLALGEQPPMRPGVMRHFYLPAGKYRVADALTLGVSSLVAEEATKLARMTVQIQPWSPPLPRIT